MKTTLKAVYWIIKYIQQLCIFIMKICKLAHIRYELIKSI